ncbi:fatty acid desaturase family protein [Streptomyces sp. YPW6]|uniref:fatty acid desaturase family protein n=1 Tax=Streptomyces sp. YPW6 TaxID=2840373 RepID=UPI001C0BBFCC|nr:fatty acid desaturase family protein [Streptomyces sp. YPW6]QWQ43010.1 fatty acid desaturase family protein [Streptomyces sp. YPW6]
MSTFEQLNFDRLAPDIRKELRHLRTLDNHHAPLAILFEYALIAVCVVLCTQVSYAFYPLALLVIGSVQRFLAHFLHESSHKVFARNRTLNLVGGTLLSGYLVGHLYGPYRSSHVGNHHRNLGDAVNDPDYSFHIECGLYDAERSDRHFFLKEVVASALGLRTFTYLGYIARERVFCDSSQITVSVPVPLRTEQKTFVAQWAVILGVCAWFGVLPELLLFWFVPLFTTNVAIGWLAELSEHYPMPESENKQILLTRNRHGVFLERFFLSRHNDRYHLVHHMNAGIPFWNLGRAHQVLLGDPGYAAWDGLWAGAFTRPRDRRDKETVISYAATYRTWRQRGGDPAAAGPSFAQLMVAAARSGAPDPAALVLAQTTPPADGPADGTGPIGTGDPLGRIGENAHDSSGDDTKAKVLS